MANSKEQAVIDFLLTFSYIAENPTFFNFTEAEADNKGIITVSNDITLNKTFIDGSVLKRYTFTIVDFKAITYQAIPTLAGYTSENLDNYLDVQTIVDWIEEQANNRNYPDLGEKCTVDKMYCTTDTPNMNGIDNTLKPNLAKYSVTIIIEYLDESKCICK